MFKHLSKVEQRRCKKVGDYNIINVIKYNYYLLSYPKKIKVKNRYKKFNNNLIQRIKGGIFKKKIRSLIVLRITNKLISMLSLKSYIQFHHTKMKNH